MKGNWKGGKGLTPFVRSENGLRHMIGYLDEFYGEKNTYTSTGWRDNEGKWHHNKGTVEWVELKTFDALLRARNVVRGRSASNIVMADPDGNSYILTTEEYVEAVNRWGASQLGELTGFIDGTWTFTKRGANYFLTPAPDLIKS